MVKGEGSKSLGFEAKGTSVGIGVSGLAKDFGASCVGFWGLSALVGVVLLHGRGSCKNLASRRAFKGVSRYPTCTKGNPYCSVAAHRSRPLRMSKPQKKTTKPIILRLQRTDSTDSSVGVQHTKGAQGL